MRVLSIKNVPLYEEKRTSVDKFKRAQRRVIQIPKVWSN
jgi:hypothetical protein